MDHSQPDPTVVEVLAEQVHAAWLAAKDAQGVTSRRSETGEELVVPYACLSEAAKDLDRATVRAVLAAAGNVGWRLVPAAAG